MSRPRTVLVVDDDPSIRLVVRKMLEASGFTVVAVGNGAAALEALDGQEASPAFGAAMIDVILPRMRGSALVRALRERAPDLPVLLMSGYARDDLEDGDLDGCDVFFNKPFQRAHLVATIDALLTGAPLPQ